MNELLEQIDDVESFSFLLVDDRVNMRRTIRNMLRTYGFCNFGDADDGDVAIKKLKNQYYDFIICDWNMPRMKGVQLLRAIREDEELSEIPFLMITGEATQDKIAEVIEAGVDGYLLKPFDIKSLENRIVEILKVRKSEPLPLEAQILLAEHYSQVGCYWQSNQELEKA
ncbi:response regulator, partial [uncultured Roseibium sp.]|uniref:response regulator n=1 Tax=uncultured Roseibium sp. TaxID=1936171 RepID=UPI003217678F